MGHSLWIQEEFTGLPVSGHNLLFSGLGRHIIQWLAALVDDGADYRSAAISCGKDWKSQPGKLARIFAGREEHDFDEFYFSNHFEYFIRYIK